MDIKYIKIFQCIVLIVILSNGCAAPIKMGTKNINIENVLSKTWTSQTLTERTNEKMQGDYTVGVVLNINQFIGRKT